MKYFDLTKDYNRDTFLDFVYDFLPDDFEQDIDEPYYDYKNIESGYKLGSCESLSLNVYEFRTLSSKDPRVTLTREVVGLMKKYEFCQNALVVFYNEDSLQWRLSLITTDYTEENGKIKPLYSNPKRFSFLLGEGCKTHTPQSLLFDKGAVKSIEDLIGRFDIEVVTKEFYIKLFSWYEWATNMVKYPKGCGGNVILDNNSNEENLIRLITRLMFVWFVKQKGLIPNWIFDKKELTGVLSDCDLLSSEKSNYYNAILQNLFFATLNKKITERSFTNDNNRSEQYGIKTFFRDDKDNSFYKIDHDSFVKKFESVPYLNGGLFECLDKRDDGPQYYNDGFSREESRRAFVPNILFWNEDENQLGIINLLNRYNFTVEENTPTDVQVALDPELLGKVFENLLGTYNPETKESARKDSGSFYTPREIVNYMVNESIIAYLQNKVKNILPETLKHFVENTEKDTDFDSDTLSQIRSAIDEIKIIDPACGSGAFPMGALNKLTQIKMSIDKSCHHLETKDEDKTLIIKKGQSIYYHPTKGDCININIKAEYLGNSQFRLYIDGNDKGMYDSQRLALIVKSEINKRNKEKGKTTIANLFSQGKIEDGKTFNTIKSQKDIHIIADEQGNIIWKYSVYNVENKYRNYRNETDALPDNLDDDYEYSKHLYKTKKYIIEHSIFGVDIQPIAVQIAKLRCFLSLIVDEEVCEDEPNRGVETLPNLETKFVAANSLIASGLGTDRQGSLFEDDEIDVLKEQLKDLRQHEYPNVNTAKDKMLLREKDKTIRKKLGELIANEYDKSGLSVIEKLIAWDPYDQTAGASPFFDAEWMFGIKNGFDIVIGNPPYGAKVSDEDKKYYIKNYEVAKTIGKVQKGSTDTFAIFINQGFNSLKIGGQLAFIVPMAVTSSDAMTSLHNMLESNCKTIKISSYSNRPKQIFDAACIRTSVLFFRKTATPNMSIFTTKLQRRRYTDSIGTIIDGLKYIDSKELKLPGRYAKISEYIEKHILTKLFATGMNIESYAKENGIPFYYRMAGGRYFNVIANYSTTNSTSEKQFNVTPEYRDVICATLSTTLFWFYQQVYTDGLNLKIQDLNYFPLPDFSKIDGKAISTIKTRYEEYLSDIERNVIQHSTYKEYKLRKSKKLIDQIDDLICPLYGLTKEETEFIKNYEIEFRTEDETKE